MFWLETDLGKKHNYKITVKTVTYVGNIHLSLKALLLILSIFQGIFVV